MNRHYVSFEQSELLKEKGCPYDKKEYLERPKVYEVIEWIFQKYNYSIEVELNIPESRKYDDCYVFNSMVKGFENYKLAILYKSKDFPNRQKAYLDAINYVLEKLV